jgi:hypothetical protein
MTTTDGTSKIEVLVLRCNECREDSTLLLRACRLRLFRHGLMVLNFFCLHCKELARVELQGVSFAEALSNAGVPTTIVDSPQEMAEHPSETVARIGEQECRYLEQVPINYFNEHVARELKLPRS